MGTIQEKAKYLEDTKLMIKDALIQKDINITSEDTFRQYAEKLKQIKNMPELKQAELSVSFANNKEIEYLRESSNILNFSSRVYGYGTQRY